MAFVPVPAPDDVVYTYDAAANPQEATVFGFPLRALTAADLAGKPTWQVASVAAAGFYHAAVASSPVPVAPSADPAPEDPTAADAATTL